jgi:Zn-dependent protease with chaperone function
MIRTLTALALGATLALGGCAVETAPSSRPTGGTASAPTGRPIDGRQAERLRLVMMPLIQNMDRQLSPREVRIGVLDDPQINAANAGGGEFYVTRGLLERANDQQLLGVMAHEVAHADLGHVAKTQTLGTGLSIGMVILDQLLPGSGAITPILGQLAVNAYSRREEYQADAHGVAILRRAGYDGKQTMMNTLTWLLQTSGAGSGGFFATHPATGDRIEAVRALP